MPKFHAINTTIYNGSVTFNGTKVAVVEFGHTFPIVPIIQITLSDTTSTSVPYKTTATASGVTIKFQTNYNGTVDWVAI